MRLLLGVLILGLLVGWHVERRARLRADAALLVSRRLNDSLVVRLASHRAPVAQGIQQAAKASNARVVAAVTVHVPARDTVIVYDTLVTTLRDDSTRLARFRDSTFAGVVEGEVTAPPCCAALSLSYRVHRPAFSPSVGFIEAGGKYAAVVSWQGERAELGTPFVARTLERQRWAAPYTQVTWGPQGWAAAAGLQLRSLGGFAPVLQLEQHLEQREPLRLGVGLRKVW